MASNTDTVSKLHDYAVRVKETDYHLQSADVEPDYEARINRTLQSLQNQVKQHQDALEKLRAKAAEPAIDEPSEDPRIRLRQLRIITAAYKLVTTTEPLLPLPNSPLPALLALRTTLNLVDQTKTSIKETKDSIDAAKARLRNERNDLQDAQSLTKALEQRIERLRLEDEKQEQQNPEAIVKAMIYEQLQRRKTHTAELRNQVIVFNDFVSTHLAAMIAAEDLGGPIVGDLLDISEDTLKAGFNQQGKAKNAGPATKASELKRKRRNEEVWGSEEEDSEMETEPRTEKEAAAAEFRALVEDLLNATGKEAGEVYVETRRESAAVRFLVRARVAQFHPEDARKLRLIDFGNELEPV